MERRQINPWTWQEQYGYNQAHEVTNPNRTLYLAGQVSVDSEGQVVHVGDIAAQFRQCVSNVKTVLGAADMTPANIVRVTVFTTEIEELQKHYGAIEELTGEGAKFASTLIGVSRLAFPGLMVEMEVTAVA